MGASVLLVDDHSGFRAQARRMLESECYRLVGEAGDAGLAIEAARAFEPELALVDVYLPDGDGFEVASRLGALDAAPAVVLTSSRDGAELGAWPGAAPAASCRRPSCRAKPSRSFWDDERVGLDRRSEDRCA